MVDVNINGVQLKLDTLPTLFSPLHADKGTLAMISTVDTHSDDKILDLGCGYGLVGIYYARMMGSANIVMSDADSDAVAMAGINARNNGVKDIRVLHSHAFDSITDRDFSIILSNPPYHVDFKVPRLFIEGAYTHLKPGGRLVMVVKRLDWYANKMKSVFGGVRLKELDGYYVLQSEKKEWVSRPEKEVRTTKKHAKRMDRTSQIRRK